MPTSVGPSYRVQLWLDPQLQATQVAIARYFDGVKQTETTWEPPPFDTLEEVLIVSLAGLAEQPPLF